MHATPGPSANAAGNSLRPGKSQSSSFQSSLMRTGESNSDLRTIAQRLGRKADSVFGSTPNLGDGDSQDTVAVTAERPLTEVAESIEFQRTSLLKQIFYELDRVESI